MPGIIVEVKGPVVDVSFENESLPKINDALKVKIDEKYNHGFAIDLTLEVALHVGGGIVRCIAMDSTNGLVRGMPVVNTNSPITVPVGEETLGRVFNVLGDPIDKKVKFQINVKECQFIEKHLLWRIYPQRLKFWKQELRLLTFLLLILRVEKLVCLVELE